MHGQHYGSPEDIRTLAHRLEASGGFPEELASLLRSIVLREGGAVPRTDLLEILTIAAAGPQMDPAGHELQQSMRQLLSFLHGVLRRPWNEPPGEERLHPPELPVEELPDHRAAEPELGRLAERGTRPNVILFGRSRAIYSRLTHIEPGSGEEFSPAPESDRKRAPIPAYEVAESAGEIRPADVPAPAPAGELVIAPGPPAQPEPTSEREPTIDEKIEPVESVVGAPVHAAAAAEYEATGPAIVAGYCATEPTPMRELVQAPDPASYSAPTVAPSQLEDVAAAVTADSDSVAANAITAEPTPDPVATALATVPDAASDAAAVISQPSLPVATVWSMPLAFDAEPPLPSSTRPWRVALVGGGVAAALLAATLIVAIRARSAADNIARPVAESSAGAKFTAAPAIANPAEAAASAKTTSNPSAIPPAKPSAYGPSLAAPQQSSRRTRPYADDYIAPPYSNMPAAQPEVRRSDPSPASSSSAQLTSSASGTTAPVVAAVQGNPNSRPHVDPDTRIVGELPVRSADNTALAERPSHLRVPSAVMAGNLISAPQPGYPMLAKLTHAEGEVVLEADISRNGTVSPIRVLSGHRLLRHAAEDAVRRWRYRPYVANGRTVDVSTTITVRFGGDR